MSDSTLPQNLEEIHLVDAQGSIPTSPALVPVNSNSPVVSTSPSEGVGDNPFPSDVNSYNEINPATRGATSINKRSKRPPAKPSSALVEAKLSAELRKRNSEGSSDASFVIKDHLQPARDAKERVRKPTGVVYDMRMVEHRCLWDEGYPEKPERFSAVIKRCQELGLLDRCLSITPRFAEQEEILKVHTRDHIEKLRDICFKSVATAPQVDVEGLESSASLYDAIYFHPSTYDLSLLATGCTIDLVNAILSDKIQNGMAIIRPPGHHAMKSEFCGYCYFNNVAVAAQLALDSGKAQRILVVDFDVHHGQATQQAFYNDPRVLYFSTHRFENGKFWPNLEESDFNFIGDSNGTGFNINIPLNKPGLGNSDFLSIWYNILIPVAYQFNPDLVIVSAGFDAALGCFEGEMNVTPQFYPHLMSPLMGLASGKVAVILEGGYCIQSLAEGAALTLRSLLGDPCPNIQPITQPDDVLVKSVLNSVYMLQPHWDNLSAVKFVDADDTNFDVEIAKENGELHTPSIKFEWNEPKPNTYATRDCYPVQSAELQRTIQESLTHLILTTSLTKAPHKVSLVYNDMMLSHRNIAEPGHPEKPERISNIFACHADYGMLERVFRLEGRYATEEELNLIHTTEHIENMKQTKSMSNKELYRLKERLNSVYFNNHTYDAAVFAAGSVLEVVDTVLNGTSQTGVAVVRPPGHHAEIDEACGFCIFNNVSLAAKYALDMFCLKRILVLDWDVHHGNGIQRMFQDDPRVLYISIHRFDYGAFFPCSDYADSKFVGINAGEGFTVNIPWNKSGMGDTEYLAAFTKIILPIAYQFNPELVLVSAGFDAAKGDPLGGCKITPEGYAHMTHLLSPLANGKVILALEGGYNLTSIAYSMVLCTKALLGDPIPPLTLNKEISRSALESIHDVLKIHAKYWSVLRPFVKYLPAYDDSVIPIGNYKKLEADSDKVSDYMENLKIEESNILNNNDNIET